MTEVSLYEFTGSGHKDPADYAAGILIFTKRTRLNMTPGLLEETMAMPYTEKVEELRYMANTIPSSWEMVDYHFLINNVTRAFTHQLVRTRTASFAQQTMRVLKMEKWGYATDGTIKGNRTREGIFGASMAAAAEAYKCLLNDGAAIEDARGVLPTNILTNIIMKVNMRTFVEMVRKRTSPRVQGEYRDVLQQMQSQVIAVHPWISLFINRTFDKAAKDLDKEIAALSDKDQATRMMKLVDQMRAQS